MSTSGGVADVGVLTVATVHLVAADIATLFSAPKQIVAAPGVGLAIVPVDVAAIELVPGASGSWDSGSTPGLFYGTTPSAGTSVMGLTGALDGLGGQPALAQVTFAVVNDVSTQYTKTQVANKAITFGQPTANPAPFGPIATSSIHAAGLGYAPGDTGTLDAGFTPPATYVIDTVGTLGVVTAFHLATAGDGYTAGADSTTTPAGAQPGIGTGFEVRVVTITAPSIELYVTLPYRVIALH